MSDLKAKVFRSPFHAQLTKNLVCRAFSLVDADVPRRAGQQPKGGVTMIYEVTLPSCQERRELCAVDSHQLMGASNIVANPRRSRFPCEEMNLYKEEICQRVDRSSLHKNGGFRRRWTNSWCSFGFLSTCAEVAAIIDRISDKSALILCGISDKPGRKSQAI